MLAISIQLQLAILVCMVTINSCSDSTEGCPNSCRGSSVSSGNIGEFGVDVSTAVSLKQFQCLKRCGYRFAITLAYENGAVDANVVSNVANAREADFYTVDIYMYPSLMSAPMKTATMQVDEIVTALQGSDYNIVWIVIAQGGSWDTNVTHNQEYFLQLVKELEGHNKTVGVYTSESEWYTIMGDEFTGGSSQKLWYQNVDGVPSFDEFISFGNWSIPFIKQFSLDVKVCATNINENWRMEMYDIG